MSRTCTRGEACDADGGCEAGVHGVCHFLNFLYPLFFDTNERAHGCNLEGDGVSSLSFRKAWEKRVSV